MKLDITAIAQGLLDKLQAQANRIDGQSEGVVLLFEALKQEIEKQNGLTETKSK